jgi:cytochrome c biogenesis protein CcmG, thiol:disulfide interchange protein DsbE
VHSRYVRIGYIVLNLLVSAVIAVADETLPVLKVGKDSYSHVTIFKITATDIYFMSDQGLANVKLKDLAPDLQKHFNYNPTNAIAVEKKQKAANNLYGAEITKSSAANQSGPSPGTQPETGKQIWAKSLLNQPAPPLYVETWLKGQPNREGKFVLIDFWATWCPPCRQFIPILNDFQKKFGDRMVIIGLSDEPEDVLRKFEGPEEDYFIASDTQARTKNIVQVTGIPHVLIIDPKGIVRWEGYPLLKDYELTESVVASILAQYSK